MPAWLTYALIRVGIFVVALVALLLLGIPWLWSAIIATVIAFCLAFVLFRRQRDAVAAEWAARRRERTADDDAEDSVVDRHRGDERD